MPGATPVFGFPYPDPSDLVANYPALGQQLAEDVEDEILAAGGGLSHVNTTAFTTQSSVSLDNVFTSTYQNYRVMINFTGSAGDTLRLRLRVGGADLSASYYGSTIAAQNNNTGLSNANVTNGAQWDISYSPSSLSSASIDIMDPVVAAKTIFYGFGINPDTTGNLRIVGGFNNNSTSYTGITIFPASGTITGTIRVYGYKNS
jgi:hypothetical protein